MEKERGPGQETRCSSKGFKEKRNTYLIIGRGGQVVSFIRCFKSYSSEIGFVKERVHVKLRCHLFAAYHYVDGGSEAIF